MGAITLQVVDGADRGRIFTDLPTPVTIGREEGNSIQLNDERISRFHLKIQEDQDKLVLTDLESTNGTKVNGEETHLHILRYGDMISLGRSVLVFGSRDDIAKRLSQLRGILGDGERTLYVEGAEGADALDMELSLNNLEQEGPLGQIPPPDLPERLSPAQAAQLSELLSYLHVRIRRLASKVKMGGGTRVTLDTRQWQDLLDFQSRLAGYLRAIADPQDQE